MADAAAVYAAELIIKVKEPLPAEITLLREGQVVFGFLHLATNCELTAQLLQRKIIGVSFETVTTDNGTLLLAPMSAVAGRVAVLAGTLAMAHGGNGTLLPGVLNVPPGRVTIIGPGMAEANAAHLALGLRADITVLDHNTKRLQHFDECYQGRIRTHYSNADAITELLAGADLVISAVLQPGKKAPKLISRQMVASMRPVRCWQILPSTRAAALKPRALPAIPTRLISRRAQCTNA